MAKESLLFPDYLFESSWEVCNKVGGIYTVLSTRAKTLQEKLKDNLIFIGPDCWGSKQCPYFESDECLYAEWRMHAHEEGLNVRVGRWKIPGNPVAVLVDFTPFYAEKNDIYTRIWELYGVDSLHAYGDYDEASMFSFAAAKVVESFHSFYLTPETRVIYHGNEWMTGLGLLYINHKLPEIATLFTTHATSIGRSIAGNNKPLYDYLFAYNGDQMAAELNMQSKHSIEKQTACHVDCFTTVSDITGRECAELLDRPADFILPNGFDNSFIPKSSTFMRKRRMARRKLLQVANALTGCSTDDDTLIISTSGRYEFRNKGIDVFIEAVNRLRNDDKFKRRAIAFIEVPGWVSSHREDLSARIGSGQTFDTPLDTPLLTHWLNNMNEDRVIGMLKGMNVQNNASSKVQIIFVPCYLTGDDGIFNMTYYDLVLGNDLCIYPSYYEPWGYTPLEAIAFKVPCITTDLAGFGLWVNSVKGKYGEIEDGVKVIHRNDYNYFDVAETIKETVEEYAGFTDEEVKSSRDNASSLSKMALWSNFIKHYYAAYDYSLRAAQKRISENN